eukprot:3369650-Rhodomonas_salina.1
MSCIDLRDTSRIVLRSSPYCPTQRPISSYVSFGPELRHPYTTTPIVLPSCWVLSYGTGEYQAGKALVQEARRRLEEGEEEKRARGEESEEQRRELGRRRKEAEELKEEIERRGGQER